MPDYLTAVAPEVGHPRGGLRYTERAGALFWSVVESTAMEA